MSTIKDQIAHYRRQQRRRLDESSPDQTTRFDHAPGIKRAEDDETYRFAYTRWENADQPRLRRHRGL